MSKFQEFFRKPIDIRSVDRWKDGKQHNYVYLHYILEKFDKKIIFQKIIITIF